MKKIQLLSPAGSFDIAEAAFEHGADAVYVGVGQYNLRAHSPNFLPQDLPELMNLAKNHGKLVYVAVNIMPDQNQFSKMEQMFASIAENKAIPDAFIISDPGVLLLCKKYFPETALHLSTQTGTFNDYAIRFWKNQGVKRIIFPRELSLKQISELCSLKIVETEVFIHGAMCMSISGRCLMGAYIAQRHPNLGDCNQPCRFKYRISPSETNCKKNGEWFDVEECENESYILNSRDLCTLDILPEIINSGVNSLKIEGRNKSIHYVASVVKTYRAAIDSCLKNPSQYKVLQEWKTCLDRVEHRPYTTGFFCGELLLQEVFTSKASSNARIVGVVKAFLDGLPVIDVKNSFSANEMLEVLPVQSSLSSYKIELSQITDLNGNTINIAPSNRLIKACCKSNLRPGDMLRKVI